MNSLQRHTAAASIMSPGQKTLTLEDTELASSSGVAQLNVTPAEVSCLE